VQRGQPLLTLYSQELVGAQLQYLAALRAREQLAPAQAADRDYQERLIETPKRRLLYWDVPEDQLRMLEKAGEPLEAVIFRSPAEGVVVQKSATRGMHVEAGETLYKLADTSIVWIEADFSPSDDAHLTKAKRTTVIISSQPTKSVTGRIVQVYPSLAEPSKTVRARIEVSNSKNDLKPGMFVTVEVAVEPSQGLVVPEDAVIDSGRRQTVFVATGNGRFEPRSVTLGLHADDQFIVLSGLSEGEQVVTRATFLLDSESRLQAALESYRDPAGLTTLRERGPLGSLNLVTDPNPARVGENSLQVQMLGADAKPVTDALIDVRLYMAPMPSMNMPAMQAGARLEHVGNGIYRGAGRFSMAGSWDVTISASRHGRGIAEKRMSITVR
jgi:RND family efflux transporter MFP subunit